MLSYLLVNFFINRSYKQSSYSKARLNYGTTINSMVIPVGATIGRPLWFINDFIG